MTILYWIAGVLALGPLHLPPGGTAEPGGVRMTSFAWLQLGGYLALLVGLGLPLGHYMARVYTGEARLAQRLLAPVERGIYRLLGIDPGREMGWREYTLAVLAISVVSLVAVYAIQRLQGVLPFNPAGFAGVPAALAFNTAVSFVTNTNWQSYGGETTMSNLTQMLALTVQNFVSAAVGMAVLAAFIRGLHRRTASTLGNAWVDSTRSVLYVLLPLAAVLLSLLLVSQGVVQTMAASREVTLVQPFQRRLVARHHPDHCRRAGRLAGGDQAAGHQRRRVLQRQLGASRSRTRRPSATCSRCWRSCSSPPRSASPSAGWSRTTGRGGPSSPRWPSSSLR